MTINSTIPYWTSTPPVDIERRLRDLPVVLADRRRRAILRVLTEYGRSLPTAELVTRLVAVERETPPTDTLPADETAVEISLVHVDLPQLAAARFVTTNREASTVELLEHPLLDDPHVEQLLARDDAWDDRIPAMAASRHRLIRTILADSPDPLPLTQLASRLCAHESLPRTAPPQDHSSTADTAPPAVDTVSIPPETPPAAAVEAMVAALHHVHLPILEAAGLVVYDTEAGTVAARSTPAPDDRWQPTGSPAVTDPDSYPVDCTADGLAIRLVVAPDGRVDDAYAYSITESAVGTVTIPSRRDAIRRRSERSPTDETVAATRESATSPRSEQWLVDCWLRHHTGL